MLRWKAMTKCKERTVSAVFATDKLPEPLAGNKIYTNFPNFALNQNVCDVVQCCISFSIHWPEGVNKCVQSVGIKKLFCSWFALWALKYSFLLNCISMSSQSLTFVLVYTEKKKLNVHINNVRLLKGIRNLVTWIKTLCNFLL